MSDEIYDPYDLSNYVKPMQPQSQKGNTNINNEYSNMKNDFNEEGENSNNDNEKAPLNKSKRKMTDEELPQKIDLTKSAYSDTQNNQVNQDNQDNQDSQINNNTSSGKNNNNTNNNNNEQNDEDDEDLPLLEELGINLQSIKNKIISIITVRRIDKRFLQDSDMAGPFLIFIIFAFSLILQKKTCFGYLYGISLFGSVLLFLLMNVMSEKGSILLYDTISILGYCLIPIVILSLIAIFLSMQNLIGGILCFAIIVCASISATRFFEIALDMAEQKWLIFYPVALFYTCFALVTIF